MQTDIISDPSIPLVVDLDGTLIKTDLLYESANQYLKRNPLGIFKMLLAFSRGKSKLKDYLAAETALHIESLPFNEEILDWLREEASKGRKIYLATASNEKYAQKIGSFLGIFMGIFASTADINLKGSAKRELLEQEFGRGGFDYLGDNRADFEVWNSARKAYVISRFQSFSESVKRLPNFGGSFSVNGRAPVQAFIKALRPHQWVKNVLIFVPLIAAHLYGDSLALIDASWTFFIFCLAASSVYLLNDLLDIEEDRQHEYKKSRPLASGDLNIVWAWILWPLLLLLSVMLSWQLLPNLFTLSLLSYLAITICYSFFLKQSAVIDVMLLAMLYTIRIIGGAFAISVPISFWLITFSLFIFVSLAFIKRFSELKAARSYGGISLRGRGYSLDDLEAISSMGVSSGYLAVLVLALYIQDAHTASLYNSPEVIWVACPLMLFWISRMWLITHRGQMHIDPIVFAIRDRVSAITALLFVVIFMAAKVL